MAYKEFREKIVKLQSDVNLFKVEFLDRDGFKRFADNLSSNVESWNKICITGISLKPFENHLKASLKCRHIIYD